MSLAYVDSSCIVAIAFDEPESTALLKRLRRFDRIMSSALLVAEVCAALRREGRERNPDLWSTVDLLNPERSLAPEIVRVLHAGYLRGADCWHVACALYLSPKPSELSFLTLDVAQRNIAKALGFRI